MKSKQSCVVWDWFMCLKTQRSAPKGVSAVSKPRSGRFPVPKGCRHQACSVRQVTTPHVLESPPAPSPSPTTPTRPGQASAFLQSSLRCQRPTGIAQPHTFNPNGTSETRQIFKSKLTCKTEVLKPVTPKPLSIFNKKKASSSMVQSGQKDGGGNSQCNRFIHLQFLQPSAPAFQH